MKAQAAYGQVLVNEIHSDIGIMLSRKEAVALMSELAEAVLQSGDISDPRSVFLAMAVQRAAADWLKE